MRVMNLAQPRAGLGLEIASSLASELLCSMLAISDLGAGPRTAKTAEDYDLGAERLYRIRSQVAPELLEELAALTAGCGKVAGDLMGVVYEAAEPRDAAALVDRLRALDPLEVTLHLLGFFMKAHRGSFAEDLVRAAVDGDEGARRRYLEEYRRSEHFDPQGYGPISRLFDLGKEEVKDRLIALLVRWHDEVWPMFDDDVEEILARDLRDKLSLAQSNSPERTIELATNGIQFVPENGINRVVLFPTYVLRPWVLISEHKDTRLFCYPVSDESVDVDETIPPPQLIKLYKALGDANRLRLLKRLSKGSMTLKEATEILGSAKSTAHHHLAILRQAGLVWVREDEDNTYTLRNDLIPQASELLQSYLRIRPPGTGRTPGVRSSQRPPSPAATGGA